jgi:membrane complex biogenesis BtpA family protein
MVRIRTVKPPAKPISRKRGGALERLFKAGKVAIGVVHCPPLPGAPDYEGEPVDRLIERSLADATAYAKGGVHGLIVENHGDIPFAKPGDIGVETTAMAAVIADQIRRAIDLPIGINILANAALPALAIAKAAQARFIRVNQWANAYVANEGLVEGEAGRALRYRSWLRAKDVAIFADVHVKHGAHAIVADRSIGELTRDVEFFGADVCIATGQRTGDAATPDEVAAIKEATGLPVVIGSGVNADNVGELMRIADGVIIASSLKRGGVWWNPVDPKRVTAFMTVFRRAMARR